MPTYRKLTKDEVLDLANRIRFEDDIDFDVVRAGIKDLFGATAHKAVLEWENAYNDEGYDLRANTLTVWDAAGKELKRDVPEDEWDEPLRDFLGEIEVSGVDENASLPDLTVFMDGRNIGLPDLYVKED